jgi:hypothetical protein
MFYQKKVVTFGLENLKKTLFIMADDNKEKQKKL